MGVNTYISPENALIHLDLNGPDMVHNAKNLGRYRLGVSPIETFG